MDADEKRQYIRATFVVERAGWLESGLEGVARG
jgi:hypothetical protein